MYDNLIAAMVRRGLTEKDVAALLGIGVTSLRKKLCGATAFTLGEIETIMKAFPDGTVEHLFRESGDGRS